VEKKLRGVRGDALVVFWGVEKVGGGNLFFRRETVLAFRAEREERFLSVMVLVTRRGGCVQGRKGRKIFIGYGFGDEKRRLLE
jgi:hypothetical protein